MPGSELPVFNQANRFTTIGLMRLRVMEISINACVFDALSRSAAKCCHQKLI